MVGGGANSTIELAAGTDAGTLNALGTTFTNFGTVIVDAGATWTVDAASSLLATTTFIGDGASSTLALTGAGTINLKNVSNFGTIDLPAGNSTVTVTDKTLSGAAVTSTTAPAATTPSAHERHVGKQGQVADLCRRDGNGHFTGGFENDTVDIAASFGGRRHADRRQRHQHTGADRRRQHQPQRGHQVPDDRLCSHRNHGDGDRCDCCPAGR